MNYYLLLVMFIVLASGCQTTPAGSATHELLVTFETGKFSDVLLGGSKRAYHGGLWPISLHVRQSVRRVENAYGLTRKDAWLIESLDLFCVVFTVPEDREIEKVIEALKLDRRVADAQPMNEFEGMFNESYDDPLFELQYGNHRLEIQRLHAISRGENVRVGVIDSNVDIDHPDLTGQVFKHYMLVDPKGVLDKRHGTAVTGVIGARADNGVGLVGLAPMASIYVYGACSHLRNATRCNSFSLAKAIEHAIQDEIQVLNMSLAGPPDPLLRRLIERAHKNGMIIIAAANTSNAERNFPASLPIVHSAGEHSEPWFARTEQFSTRAGGGYQVFYGSSVAAAGVTGLTTLLRSQWSASETDELLHRLLNLSCGYVPIFELLEEATVHCQ
ncbi:MAG: S8 family serine peptidase [Gammaproteobacteria bacterium]|nr:S8 family serine peptidase [Gammaproteobacteria bacterium]